MRARWNVDPARMLLTGMSDGGTFCYVTGFESASPFTHLAPVSATFHPLMAEMADAERLRGLPVHIVHGQLDWMFPVQVARQTSQALSAAGANVTYRELDDLSHTYPREMNAEILQWLNGDRPDRDNFLPPQRPINARKGAFEWRRNHAAASALSVATEGFAMQTFVGMILGALLLVCGVYVYDSMQTSSVANGQVAQANRTIVNWDVAAADWNKLKTRAHEDWVRISSK